MQRIKEYKILSAIYTKARGDEIHTRLAEQVNEYISAGWQPYGQMTITPFDGAVIVAQPVVRYTE